MPSDTRTPDAIERDIASERARMNGTISDLQQKFSFDAIVNDLGHMLRGQGGDLYHTVRDTVARNPAAVALTGVGLAWLFLGQDRKQSATSEHRRASGHGAGGWSSAARGKRYTGSTYTGSNHGTPDAFEDGEDSSWFGGSRGSQDGWQREQGTSSGSRGASGGNGTSDGMMGSVRRRVNAAGHALSDAAGGWGDTASDISERLSHGLEDLSEEARARVLSARRAAHEARLSSEEAMNRGSRAATDFFEDQPLVAGALAVAVGAAIGAVLPSTKFEDDTMGDSSDQLFAEAQAVYREERDKAKSAARTAATEVRDDLAEMGADLGETVTDHASESVGRVLDRTSGKPAQKDEGRSET